MDLPQRYKFTGKHFSGGMAGVAGCHDSVLERDVAIKIIPATVERRRLIDEVGALLKLRSKHVVQIYDLVSSVSGELAIVQEFLAGSDLFDPDVRPQSLADYYKLCWQISAGIADIHAQGVIHRDIKPNNMKIDAEGLVKIFDFGLSRDEGPGAMTMGFAGTRGFAAPELYHPPFKFTQAIDTYAFGATALFLLTGTLPKQLLDQPPKPLPANEFAGSTMPMPTEVADILFACLEPAPQDRPSMGAVRDMLGKQLMRDRHQALLVFNQKPVYVNANKPVGKISGRLGGLDIRYDGLRFTSQAIVGDVYINNLPAVSGGQLPGSCVIALGASTAGAQRSYITFDVSHPEIML